MVQTFTYSPKMELIASDGPKVTKALANMGASGKVLLDDTFANDDIIDVGDMCSNISVPTYLQIKCANQGVQFNLDGLGYSTKVITAMLVEIRPDGTGLLDLLLKAQGPAQRIEILVVGEP